MDGDHGPIVQDFSGRIPRTGLTVLVGPSGAGKTTLLRLLNRLDDPDRGSVLLDGRDVRSYEVLALRRRVQYVGQVPVTFPGTVADNLGPVDAAALLERVGLDDRLLEREADRLSVGEAQRLCLARALACQPEVLVLDEPTSALDGENRASIEQLVRALADDGLTVVLVTHNEQQARVLSDHIIEVRPCRM